MTNPLHNFNISKIPGFGESGKPKQVQTGTLWKLLVNMSECKGAPHSVRVAASRYKTNPDFLLAMAYAKFAQEIMPLAYVSGDEDMQRRYISARLNMLASYENFVNRYQRGGYGVAVSNRTIMDEMLAD